MRTPSSTQMILLDPLLSSPTPTPSRIRSDVGETSRLSITMKVETPSRKRIVYRAVQRRDGVIVEKPRYRPSSQEPPAPNGKLPVFVDKISTTEAQRDIGATQVDWIGQMDEPLAGVGAFVGAERELQHRKGGAGARGYPLVRLQSGRGGYNGTFHMESDGKFFEKASRMSWESHRDHRGRNGDFLLNRFLEEPGPWNPHRGGSVEIGPLRT